MAKASGSLKRYDEPKPTSMDGVIAFGGPPEIEIAAWCPDREGKLPPEQVHLNIIMDNGDRIILRFKGPDTLGALIEELERYRKFVWKDAETLDLSGAFPEKES